MNQAETERNALFPWSICKVKFLGFQLYKQMERWVANWKGLWGSGRDMIEMLSQNLPGDTEDNQEKPVRIS